MLSALFYFFKLFHKKQDEASVSWSMVLGLFIALTPKITLIDMLLFIVSWIFGFPFLGLALGTFLGICFYSILDPFLLFIGELLLVKIKGLEGFWFILFDIPGIFLFQLNNTLMLGSTLFMGVFAYPLFLVFRYIIVKVNFYLSNSPLFKPIRTFLNGIRFILKVPTLSSKDNK